MAEKTELERDFEKDFVIEIQMLGGYCEKLKNQIKGWPDRHIYLPYGIYTMVELKRRDGKSKGLSPAQKFIHKRLREKGHKVFVIDSDYSLKVFLDWAEAKIEAAKIIRAARIKYRRNIK